MSTRNSVQQGYDRFGAACGFEKRSGSWYLRGDEVIAIVNLQKSQYAPRYYLNVGLWITELGDEKFPKTEASHIYTRLDGFVPEIGERFVDLLDLEYAISDEVRIVEIASRLEEWLLPFFRSADSVSGLQALAAAGAFNDSLVRGEAHALLGISYS